MASLSPAALAAELSSALERDRLARAVDAAKMRALHTSASYEEFRNRVACAGQAPVGRGALAIIVAPGAPPQRRAAARGLLSGGGGGGWAGDGGGGGGPTLATPAAPPLRSVRSAAEFYRAWRAAKAAPDAAFEELAALAAARSLATLLRDGGRSDLDGVALAEIVACCAGAVARAPSCAPVAADLLLQLAAVGGFELAAAMLSGTEAASAAHVLGSAGVRDWGAWERA